MKKFVTNILSLMLAANIFVSNVHAITSSESEFVGMYNQRDVDSKSQFFFAGRQHVLPHLHGWLT